MKQDTPPATLRNPEAAWERLDSRLKVGLGDVTRRLGCAPKRWHIVSGGLANANIAFDGKILRIYKRDQQAREKEHELLRRSWRSFKVPEVLGSGPDFLVLDYLRLEAVPATRAWGRQAGRALAEIHATKFQTGGLLDGRARVTDRFPDLNNALQRYLEEQLSGIAGRRLGDLAKEVRTTFSEWRASIHEQCRSPRLLHGDFKPSNLHRCGVDLVVLDWEFAWSGPPMMDIGQLLRWDPPDPFVSGFAEGYRTKGGLLPTNWRKLACVFDLVNLVGLLETAKHAPKRLTGVRRRICQTLSETRANP